jgi:hypothetical protein
MYKLLIVAFLFGMMGNVYGQINPADSTLQVVGYWQNKEKQSFSVSHEKYKLTGTDTTARELITYQVDITIKDSTAKGYTIEWFYRNYAIQSENALAKKLIPLFQDIAVLIQTNEYGAITGVSNWQEVRDYMQKMATHIEGELTAIPHAKAMMTQLMAMYQSKEAIEANAIKDAQQFYTFHGAKYSLGEELKAKMQLRNNYGGKHFDTDVTVSLDELNEQEGYGIIRMYQQVNPQQLTDATYAFLKQLSPVKNTFPARDAFPLVSNEIWTASQIHAGSGWIIYSVETKQVKAENVTNIEERIIQLN